MNHLTKFVITGLSAALLTACGGGGNDTAPETNNPGVQASTPQTNQPQPTARSINRPMSASTSALEPASCNQGTDLAGGRSYRVEMPSRVDGAAIVFEVFEPSLFDCDTRHPLILQGHGFSGSRTTTAGNDPLSPIKPLIDAGYAVISIDQRGHGESGGTVRVMDPDFEGEDLVQIVDWAEIHLDYLKYRDNNLLLGGVGGSYGGGFQYLLYNVDPDQRMDAMVPQITWHDLTYSLNQGGVTKNYWAAFLSLVGDAGTGGSMDPLIRSSLIDGILQNRFPEAALDFLHYHSPSYFSDNEGGLELFDSGNSQEYLLDPITGRLPITSDGRYIIKTPQGTPYPVDVLMFQGMRDSLFPFNEAYENYLSMKKAGGDVRLLTYPFSHHYLAPNVGLIQETLASFDFYLDAVPELPAAGLNTLASCGDIEINRATVAWFNEKLLDKGNADNVITTGQQICYTLSPGDAVSTPEVTVGGDSFPIAYDVFGSSLPVQALIGAAGVAPTIVPLTTMPEAGVIAGIPTVNLNVSLGLPALDEACLESSDPILGLGTCDAILFVGVGVTKNGLSLPELIDEQVQPIRGLGNQQVQLTGVAERLSEGDRLVLMIYGQHPTFVGAFSRDLVVSTVQVSGEVALPILTSDGQERLASIR
ncbi:CocE/NonD family hydrolase [Marinobacter halophilus]|uniref:Peptidase S15 n=1 Tax=Marinobacter halophilus TaxID=1323740 RepID=A0A2T1KB88_9GAMM|nr:CocE/NonD family hydrolase [Marinobacter halophilus]PSF07385.1 peptidase S15 [Marinobacter halophilus]